MFLFFKSHYIEPTSFCNHKLEKTTTNCKGKDFFLACSTRIISYYYYDDNYLIIWQVANYLINNLLSFVNSISLPTTLSYTNICFVFLTLFFLWLISGFDLASACLNHSVYFISSIINISR